MNDEYISFSYTDEYDNYTMLDTNTAIFPGNPDEWYEETEGYA